MIGLKNLAPLCKGGEIRDTKTLNLSRNTVSLQVFVDVSRFFSLRNAKCHSGRERRRTIVFAGYPFFTLRDQKHLCCGLKKVVTKSRAWVFFERQILALLLVLHQTYNLSRNNFARALTNQPISAPHFLNPQQMFLVTQGEKRVAYENSRPSSLPTRVAFRVSQAKKTGNIDENLQRNNVAQQVEDFCISYFAAFTGGFFFPSKKSGGLENTKQNKTADRYIYFLSQTLCSPPCQENKERKKKWLDRKFILSSATGGSLASHTRFHILR